eukprot:GEMP01015778.1.p1 GENE.GEMP01015778.1~~GEMP01015778.1.p1  ORF type:complete len:330 (+),score=88.64 GEMP01015778.1:36-1025(+)
MHVRLYDDSTNDTSNDADSNNDPNGDPVTMGVSARAQRERCRDGLLTPTLSSGISSSALPLTAAAPATTAASVAPLVPPLPLPLPLPVAAHGSTYAPRWYPRIAVTGHHLPLAYLRVSDFLAAAASPNDLDVAGAATSARDDGHIRGYRGDGEEGAEDVGDIRNIEDGAEGIEDDGWEDGGSEGSDSDSAASLTPYEEMWCHQFSEEYDGKLELQGEFEPNGLDVRNHVTEVPPPVVGASLLSGPVTLYEEEWDEEWDEEEAPFTSVVVAQFQIDDIPSELHDEAYSIMDFLLHRFSSVNVLPSSMGQWVPTRIEDIDEGDFDAQYDGY